MNGLEISPIQTRLNLFCSYNSSLKMQKCKMGEKGDEVASLEKIALLETSNNNFRCGLQTNC